MSLERDSRFGVGLGIGVVLGLLLGSLFVARLGDDASRAARSLSIRVTGRSRKPRFEALLQ